MLWALMCDIKTKALGVNGWLSVKYVKCCRIAFFESMHNYFEKTSVFEAFCKLISGCYNLTFYM